MAGSEDNGSHDPGKVAERVAKTEVWLQVFRWAIPLFIAVASLFMVDMKSDIRELRSDVSDVKNSIAGTIGPELRKIRQDVDRIEQQIVLDNAWLDDNLGSPSLVIGELAKLPQSGQPAKL